MGFNDDLLQYFWNWLVYLQVTGALAGCWNGGIWDLFWGNDDGYNINRCLHMNKGLLVETWPITYELTVKPADAA